MGRGRYLREIPMRLDEAAVALKYSICDADLITPTDVKTTIEALRLNKCRRFTIKKEEEVVDIEFEFPRRVPCRYRQSRCARYFH